MKSARGGGGATLGTAGGASLLPPLNLLFGLQPESWNFWFTCGFLKSLQGLVVRGAHHQMGVPAVCVQGGTSQGEALFPPLVTVLTPDVGFPAPASLPVSEDPAGGHTAQLTSDTVSPVSVQTLVPKDCSPPFPQRPARVEGPRLPTLLSNLATNGLPTTPSSGLALCWNSSQNSGAGLLS